jgi:hypothetical protein
MPFFLNLLFIMVAIQLPWLMVKDNDNQHLSDDVYRRRWLNRSSCKFATLLLSNLMSYFASPANFIIRECQVN